MSTPASASGMIVRQFSGQTSMQASHSMHRFAVKFVCMSQLRHRCTSAAVCSALNPSSTSTPRPLNRFVSSSCCIFMRGAEL